MGIKTRTLITTSDERTWKFNSPIIFLGRWCTKFSRAKIWKDLDFVIAKPYGITFKEKYKDFNEVLSIEDKLFPLIVNLLNDYHDVNYSERIWGVIIGSWFRRHIEVILNRVKTLKSCLEANPIDCAISFVENYNILIPLDSLKSVELYNLPEWNSMIYGLLLSHIDSSLQIKYISHSSSINSRPFSSLHNTPAPTTIYNIFAELVIRIFKFPYFIYHIPIRPEVKMTLNFFLNRFYMPWKIPSTSQHYSFNLSDRNVLSNNLVSLTTKYSSLEKLIAFLVFKIMPISYIEGFHANLAAVRNLKLPVSPSIILTSAQYQFHELFKLYIADNLCINTRLLVFQHGNKYGTHTLSFPSSEEKFADYFLTWGWTIFRSTKYISAFQIRPPRMSLNFFYKSSRIGLIQFPLDHQRRTFDTWHEHELYFNDQLTFLSSLSSFTHNELLVRLHSQHVNSAFEDYFRWSNVDPQVDIDDGLSHFRYFRDRCKILVFSYDSTGFLESLSSNFPVIGFWRNPLSPLSKEAADMYQLLINEGILHTSPESAASFLNSNYTTLASWWQSTSLQSARRLFCKTFANRTRFLSFDLIRLLSSINYSSYDGL